MLVIGLLGLSSPLLNKKPRYPLFIITTFVVVWYAVHEISPMKPYGIERYMVPVVPLLLVLGGAFLEAIASRNNVPWRQAIVPLVIVAAAVPAMYGSYRILGSEKDDPRSVIALSGQYLGSGTRILDPFSAFDRDALMFDATGGAPTPPDTIIRSGLVVDRYLRYGEGAAMAESGQGILTNIQQTFVEKRWPHVKIANDRPGYSYLNPVIYVIATDGNLERAREIAQVMRILAENNGLDVSAEVVN